jgi:hypothetical protein
MSSQRGVDVASGTLVPGPQCNRRHVAATRRFVANTRSGSFRRPFHISLNEIGVRNVQDKNFWFWEYQLPQLRLKNKTLLPFSRRLDTVREIRLGFLVPRVEFSIAPPCSRPGKRLGQRLMLHWRRVKSCLEKQWQLDRIPSYWNG